MSRPKKTPVVEVVVLLTPDQLLSIYNQNPNEWSFTRQLVQWHLAGRHKNNAPFLAKYVEKDKNRLKVTPKDDLVPAFYIPYT